MIDYGLIWQSLPALLRGTILTLQIALFSACIGICLGVLIACAEKSRYFFCVGIAKSYVAIFRGTPLLVQILFVYYVLPQWGISMSAFAAAIVGLGLNAGAYISQIIRSGMQSVCIGQIEAAITLGMSSFTIMRYIVLPQAFSVMLPALASELSVLVKESSLASIIGVMELSKEASLIRSRTYDAFSLLFASAVIYFLITTMLSCLVKKWEKQEKKYVASM